MASSPSEFLTFFRRINTAPTLRQSTRYLAHPSIPRPFTTSLASRKEGEDIGPEKEHTVDKAPKDAHTNVHSHQSKAGREYAHDKGHSSKRLANGETQFSRHGHWGAGYYGKGYEEQQGQSEGRVS